MANIEELNTVIKLKILKPCMVGGKSKNVGEVVELSGNDKIQLLASKKAERYTETSKAK